MRTRHMVTAFVLGVTLASLAAPGTVRGEPPAASPEEYFTERRSRIPGNTTTFDALVARPNLPAVAQDLAGNRRYLGDEVPTEAADLATWSHREQGPEGFDLPLRWNAERAKFEVLPRQLAESSDAIVTFTWHFLRTYNALHPALRDSGSTLAVGVAALVASEVVYPQNWAALPVGLQVPAAIVNILLLYEPGLLQASYEADPVEHARLLAAAVQAMCRVQRGGEDGEGMTVVRPIHDASAALARQPMDQAFQGAPIRLSHFLPPHPNALGRLVDKVREEITNVTLRSLIVALAAEDTIYASLVDETTKDRWSNELDRMLLDVREDMSARTEGVLGTDAAERPPTPPLAPAFSSGQVVVGDPTVLRSLMLVAGHVLAEDLAPIVADAKAALAEVEEGAARQQRFADMVDGIRKKFMATLRANKATKAVLDLAGSEPLLDLRPAYGNGAAMARLTWESLVRTHPEPGEVPRTESVTMVLVDLTQTGQGKPFAGVDVNTWVIVQEDGQPLAKRAGDVERGARIRGVTHTGSPAEGARVRLDAPLQQETWFTVLAKREHEVTYTVALGLVRDGQQHELIAAGKHAVFLRTGDTAVWREAENVDPGSSPWTSDGAAASKSEIVWVKPLRGLRTIVEFSLGGERRGEANNFLVSTSPDDSSVRALVEARPVTAGPVDPTEPILLLDGSTVPVGEVIVNPELKRDLDPEGTVVVGFHRKDELDPWPANPPLSDHASYVLKKHRSRVREAFRLEFEDDSVLRIGPQNWLLVSDGGTIKEVAAEAVEPGAQLVSGTVDGRVETLTLRKRTKVPAPEIDYELLELANVRWAKIGPVVVSVDFRPRHQRLEGLSPGTAIAFPKRRDGGVVLSAEEFALRAPPTLPTKPIALYDHSIPRFVDVKLAAIGTLPTTRTVEIVARRGSETVTIECGESQAFLVVDRARGEGSTRYEYPPLLTHGDFVFVARPGDAEATPWEVERVSQMFHPLEDLLLPISAKRQTIFGQRDEESLSFVGIGNGLAVEFAAPTAAGPGSLEWGPEGEGGKGKARGKDKGDVEGGLAEIKWKEDLGPHIMLPKPPSLADAIALPPAGRKQLERRAEDLLAVFDGEAESVRAPGRKPILLFWSNLFESESARSWPFDDADIATVLSQWITDFVVHRREFLEQPGPYSERLAVLLFEEMMLASWLWEADARETANLLLGDLTELAVYAGCEAGKEGARLGADLRLPVMLHVPSFVRNRSGQDGDASVELGTHALAVARAWATAQGFAEEIIDESRISPSGLYTYWAQAAKEANLKAPRIYWEAIPPVGEGGELADSSEAARHFKEWLRAQAKAPKSSSGRSKTAGG